jgi:Icc protein
VSDRLGLTPGEALRIVQITDTHLYADPEGRLLGLNTRHCLDSVIELMLQSPPPDVIVASGDLAHDGSPSAYRQLRSSLARTGVPAYCLPGNHDDTRNLREHLSEGGCHCVRELVVNGWQLLFLDSTVTGSDAGHLASAELSWLESTLGSRPSTPAVIWLHHQPLAIGSAWLDQMKVDNGHTLLALLDHHPQVRAVVWGHVHQVVDRQRNGVRLLASPSSCAQFMPGSERFAVEQIPPGFRWLTLQRDGSLETGVKRLARMPGEIDLSGRDY